MRHRAMQQRSLFQQPQPSDLPQLPQAVRQQAQQLLAQWMQALAQAIGEEARDEQDQR